MIVRFLVVLTSLLLFACASGPVPPEWQANAYGALNSYSNAYLSGNTRIADADFVRARSELARTGRFELVARAELVRCGTQLASLELNDCPGFVALAGDAGAAEQAYADFLLGKKVDAALLPQHYRAILENQPNALATITTPLARLIGAGVLMRNGQLTPADIELAINTASEQGWRRALLAWLGVQAQFAEKNGDAELAARARRRIELVGGSR